MKEKYKAIIEDYGYDGEGVTHLNGKVVFIPYCLQGEEVEFVLTEDKASFSKGMIENIVSASKERVEPPCPYFTKCGGCAYQHCGYQKELQIKKSLLEKQLKKVDFNKDVEVVASDCEYGYRNKITLFVDDNGLALKKRGTHEHCNIEKCYIVKDRINHAIEEINIFLKAQRLTSVYDKIVIRQESDALLINFYINRDKEVNYQGLFLLIGGECGIFETYDKKTKHLLGMDCFKVDELGLKCKFKPTSFHQVNNSVAERLYKEVLKEVKGNTIINCYSGAGVLSGVIAREKKRVFGIELGKSEHNDAEALKDENNLFYLTNLCGDCACILPNIGENANTIIVDPPRSGMDKKVVDAINQKDSDRLIYISCNSATFVRDAARLENYRLSSVKLFDMFPRTGEYELLAVLEKADK